MQRLYTLLFILRRLIFVIFAFYLQEYGTLQIIMMQYVNILQVLYIGLVTPSISRRSNRTDLVNEFLIQCIQVNLFIFTSWVPEPEIQYTYGWIMIVELYIFLVINGMIIIYDAFSIVVLIFYKYYLQMHKMYEVYRDKQIQAPVLKR